MKTLSFLFVSFFLFSLSLKSQWVQTSGPYMAQIDCFAEVGSTFLCGTNAYGLYSTNNINNSWSVSNPPSLPNTDINCFFVDGTNVYAGTEYDGCYMSSDNGVSWAPKKTGMPSITNVAKIAKWNNILFATTNQGLYKSVNNGNNWSLVSALSANPTYGFISVGNTLFVGRGNNGIYSSSDGGSNWTNSSVGLPLGSTVSSFDTLNGNILAVTSMYGLFLSNDNGLTWNQLSNNIPTNDITSITVFVKSLYIRNSVFTFSSH